MKSFKILNSNTVLLLILLSLVLTLTLGVYFYSGKEISLEVDGIKTEMVSYSKTVEEFLQKDDVDFQEGAYISLPLDTKIEDDLNIIIINPKTYMIRENDDIKEIRSIYKTVEEVIKDQKIELGELDYTNLALTEKIEENTTIEIFRVIEDVIITKDGIPFEEQKENTDSLYKGETKVKQEGENGELETHIKHRYVNGTLEKSEVVKEEVTREKKDNIILVGTKEKPAPKPVVKAKTESNTKAEAKSDSKENEQKAPAEKAPDSEPSRGSANGRTITMEATAYTDNKSSQGQWVGQTATGMKPQVGVIAVDPRVIPLGTKLYIEGYGNAIAGDTGGDIKGNRIDLFLNSESECRAFGRRQVKVTILN